MLSDQYPSSLMQLRLAVLENRLNQLVLGPEVILNGGVIATTGLSADLAQRHALETALSQQPLGSMDDLLLG